MSPVGSRRLESKRDIACAAIVCSRATSSFCLQVFANSRPLRFTGLTPIAAMMSVSTCDFGFSPYTKSVHQYSNGVYPVVLFTLSLWLYSAAARCSGQSVGLSEAKALSL